MDGAGAEWGEPGSFPALQRLALSNNPIGGLLPGSWGSMPALQALVLSNASLVGDVPPGQCLRMCCCTAASGCWQHDSPWDSNEAEN